MVETCLDSVFPTRRRSGRGSLTRYVSGDRKPFVWRSCGTGKFNSIAVFPEIPTPLKERGLGKVPCRRRETPAKDLEELKNLCAGDLSRLDTPLKQGTEHVVIRVRAKAQ